MADNQSNRDLNKQAILQQFSVTIIPKQEKEYEDMSPLHECVHEGNLALSMNSLEESMGYNEVLTYKQGSEDATTGKEVSPGFSSETAAYPVPHQTLYGSSTVFSSNHRNRTQGQIKGKAGIESSGAWMPSSTQTIHAASAHKVGSRYLISPHSNRSLLYVIKSKGPEFSQAKKKKIQRKPVSWLKSSLKMSSFKKQAGKFFSAKNIPKLKASCSLSHAKSESRKFRRQTVANYPTLDKAVHHCVECAKDMETRNHFGKHRKCSECCYATNCSAAFTNHRKECHSTRKTRRQTSNKRERTPQFYCLCICGFVSCSGNKTASHLLKCPEMSCYCTPGAEVAIDVDVCEEQEKSPGSQLMGEPVKDEEEDWIEIKSSSSLSYTSEPEAAAESSTMNHAVHTFRKKPVQIEVNFSPFPWSFRVGKRKRKQWFDPLTQISSEKIKLQLSDTFDIVTTLELAPPTKKLMLLKERGSVEGLLRSPSRAYYSKTVSKLFLKNCRTLREDMENHT